MKFRPGRILATPGAIQAMTEAGANPASFLARHLNGDWGDLDSHDKQMNEAALVDGSRIFSSYKLGDGKLWVISEATGDDGRECTTLLLPSEY